MAQLLYPPMILAGIDEAGYGPTLGPLVVSVSVFRVTDPAPAEPEAGAPCLWKLLAKGVTSKPDGVRTAVADSKKLFNQKKGLMDLEEGLLPFILLKEGALPRNLRALLGALARRGADAGEPAAPDAYLDEYPWYRDKNIAVPLETYLNVVSTRGRALRETLEKAGVELLGLAARPIDVREFNAGLEETGNKALVSFGAVASFLDRLWKQFPGEAVEVVVDRQGGRMKYGPHLFGRLQPRSLRIEAETDELSSYVLRRPGRGASALTWRVSFATESEDRSLPVALASMLSKYLREVHMALFNRFWREHRADLKPTAGYATDARRFLEDISPLRERLGIDPAALIRRR